MSNQMSVSVRALLSKATNNTATPTPGYVYHELLEHCKSYPDTIQPIVSYLIKKLDRDPIVRLKCIKILKFFAENYSYDFIRHLSPHTNAIKTCSTLNDADEHYRSRISQEVDNLLQIIYSASHTQSAPNSYSTNYNNSNNMYDQTGQQSPYRSDFTPKGYGNTYQTTSKRYFAQSPAEQAISYIHSLANKYVPPKIMSHMERIGSMVVEKAKTATSSFNTTYNSQQPNPIRMPTSTFNSSVIQLKTSNENYEKEEAIFHEAMKTGGVMVAPSIQVVELMCKKASKLDLNGVGAAVIKCLSQPDSKNGKSYCRALCLLEGLLTSEYLSNDQHRQLSDYIIENGLECLYRCKVSPSLRKVSERVLRLLKLQGPEDAAESDLSEAGYAFDRKQSEQSDSLLDLSGKNSAAGDLLDLSFHPLQDYVPNRKPEEPNLLDVKTHSMTTTDFTASDTGVNLLNFDSNDINKAPTDVVKFGGTDKKKPSELIEDISSNDIFSFIQNEIGINKT